MADVKGRLDEITRQAMDEVSPKAASDAAPDAGGMNDLLVRFVSAVAMAGVTLIALWLGGWFWIGFVVLLAGLILWEWNGLASRFAGSPLSEIAWLFVGALYVGAAAHAMVQVRLDYGMWAVLIAFVLPVVAVDVGAYFAGRAIGGPRIMPSVSPSKTWAGLGGGALAAGIVCIFAEIFDVGPGAVIPSFDVTGLAGALAAGVVIAIIAQAGDFFESSMKRRAGVKDSSKLIPGHGGIFDRLDGFLAVFFVLFLLAVLPAYMSGF